MSKVKLNLRKVVAIVICLAGFGISANAQQKYYAGGMYKDSYISAYIKEQSPMNNNCQSKLRKDALYIKNNSNETVEVEISYKSVEIDCSGKYFGEKMRYETHKISPNGDYTVSGYLHESRYSGSYYVESFSIINVKGPRGSSTSSSNSSYETQQGNSMPTWLRGNWFATDDGLFVFGSSDAGQLIWYDGSTASITSVEGNIVRIRSSTGNVGVITRINDNFINYEGVTTGSRWSATKR